MVETISISQMTLRGLHHPAAVEVVSLYGERLGESDQGSAVSSNMRISENLSPIIALKPLMRRRNLSVTGMPSSVSGGSA